MPPIHVLSRAVIIADEHILLAYDPREKPFHYYELDQTFYYLPGGHVNFQESCEKSVLREIKEETGLDAVIERFLGVIEHAWHFSGDEVCCHTHEINLIFQCHLPGISCHSIIPQQETHVAMHWIALHDIAHCDIRPSLLKQRLLQWLEQPLTKENPFVFSSTILPSMTA